MRHTQSGLFWKVWSEKKSTLEVKPSCYHDIEISHSMLAFYFLHCTQGWKVASKKPRFLGFEDKKALLSQRRPRDAPNIWVP